MDENILFSCVCNEPNGPIERTVKLVEFSPDNLTRLYKEVSKFKTFLGYEVRDMQDMTNIFFSSDLQPKGLCLIVDDFVGLFWLTDINGLFEASVHYTFFDRRHKGRIELCKKALEYAFNTFGFQRLTTTVPETHKWVGDFVKSLGFVCTGRHRKNRIVNGGQRIDTILYDLLAEEFLNGRVK